MEQAGNVVDQTDALAVDSSAASDDATTTDVHVAVADGAFVADDVASAASDATPADTFQYPGPEWNAGKDVGTICNSETPTKVLPLVSVYPDDAGSGGICHVYRGMSWYATNCPAGWTCTWAGCAETWDCPKTPCGSISCADDLWLQNGIFTTVCDPARNRCAYGQPAGGPLAPPDLPAA